MLPIVLGLLDSPGELLVVLLLVVLLFGSAKIPELARNLGKAKAEFNKAQREAETEPKPAATAAAMPVDDEKKTLEAAHALGIPTEGRPLTDVKMDIRKRMA